jgi:hypothetical protein
VEVKVWPLNFHVACLLAVAGVAMRQSTVTKTLLLTFRAVNIAVNMAAMRCVLL